MPVRSQTIDIATIAAATAEDRYYVHGFAEKQTLLRAYYVPSTTDAASGTNYTTISLINGAVTLGSLSNETVAFTAGTAREFTLTGGASLDLDTTDVLNLDKAETGTGGILDGAIVLIWRGLHAV
jgi:hypothetical protein